MDLNKEKQISKATILKKYGNGNTMSQNIIVFGTIVEDKEFWLLPLYWLIDYIYYFKDFYIKCNFL